VITSFAQTVRTALALPATRICASALVSVAVMTSSRGVKNDVYNVLWAVVFGFATLNILSLATRRMEPTRRGLSFGELMAVAIVLVSLVLLGWEILTVLHIFPIKLQR
jgi:hypothetical protein